MNVEQLTVEKLVVPPNVFSLGNKLMNRDLGIFIGVFVLGTLASGLLSEIVVGPALIMGPVIGSLYMMYFALMQGRKIDFEMVLDGFKYRFLQLFLLRVMVDAALFIVIGILFFFNFLLMLIPVVNLLTIVTTPVLILLGILLAAVVHYYLMFAPPLLADRTDNLSDAIKGSCRIVSNNHSVLLCFYIKLVGINILGFLACCVGLFYTMPLSIAAIATVYRENFPLQHTFGADPSTGEKDPNGPYANDETETNDRRQVMKRDEEKKEAHPSQKAARESEYMSGEKKPNKDTDGELPKEKPNPDAEHPDRKLDRNKRMQEDRDRSQAETEMQPQSHPHPGTAHPERPAEDIEDEADKEQDEDK
ncbi:MAG: hypothetical protein U5N86_09525 [Planctomycetota bacterium]|nr:hypothetical protein [Planctomycetota bacterium]